MATKKINLVEFRDLVKKIIKEEIGSNRITFKPSDWNKNLNIVYIDGKPINGSFVHNKITAYFDDDDKLSMDEINSIINNQFDVKSKKTGWATKNQLWVEWELL